MPAQDQNLDQEKPQGQSESPRPNPQPQTQTQTATGGAATTGGGTYRSQDRDPGMNQGAKVGLTPPMPRPNQINVELDQTYDPLKPLQQGTIAGMLSTFKTWSHHTFKIEDEDASPDVLENSWMARSEFLEGMTKTGEKRAPMKTLWEQYQLFLNQWMSGAPKMEDFTPIEVQNQRNAIMRGMTYQPERRIASHQDVNPLARGFSIGRALRAAISGEDIGTIASHIQDPLDYMQERYDTQYGDELKNQEFRMKVGDMLLDDLSKREDISQRAFDNATKAYYGMGEAGLRGIEQMMENQGAMERARLTQEGITSRFEAALPIKAWNSLAQTRNTSPDAAYQQAVQMKAQGLLPADYDPRALLKLKPSEQLAVARTNYTSWLQGFKQKELDFRKDTAKDLAEWRNKRLLVDAALASSLIGHRENMDALNWDALNQLGWYRENMIGIDDVKLDQNELDSRISLANHGRVAADQDMVNIETNYKLAAEERQTIINLGKDATPEQIARAEELYGLLTQYQSAYADAKRLRQIWRDTLTDLNKRPKESGEGGTLAPYKVDFVPSGRPQTSGKPKGGKLPDLAGPIGGGKK